MEININIPDGKIGNWEVSTFEITESDAKLENLRASMHPGSRYVYPGKYKSLTRCGAVIMSNTQAEISDLHAFIHIAKRKGGNILINGLGLGVALTAILESDNISNVTVIEKSPEVIQLVGVHFRDQRVNIINADAFEWKPPRGTRYQAVWHDIWDNICVDNLKEMTRLHRRFGRYTEWQDSWCKALCKKYSRR